MLRKMSTIIATCIIASLITANSYANTPELSKDKEKAVSKAPVHKAVEKKSIGSSPVVTITFKNFPKGTQLQWSAASFSTGFSNESNAFYTFSQSNSYTLSLTERQIQTNCGVPVAQLSNSANNCMVQINLPCTQSLGSGVNITGSGSYTADYNSGNFGTC